MGLLPNVDKIKAQAEQYFQEIIKRLDTIIDELRKRNGEIQS